MKIDFMEKKIVVTKKFLANASRYGTEEFKQLAAVTKELPDYMIEEKPVSHCLTPMKGLTYSKMEYIIRTEGEDEDLNQFYSLRSMEYNYGIVSKWFLSKYPAAIGDYYRAA